MRKWSMLKNTYLSRARKIRIFEHCSTQKLTTSPTAQRAKKLKFIGLRTGIHDKLRQKRLDKSPSC
jgi:hypothetical protein